LLIDFYGYLYCKKNNTNKYIFSNIFNNNIITNKKEIWNHCKGIIENNLIQKKLFNESNDILIKLNTSTELDINNDI